MNLFWHRARKLALATLIITLVGVPLLLATGIKPSQAATGLLLFGTGVGAFEEFYFQAKRGEWVRRLHPLLSLALSLVVTLAITYIAVLINLVLWGNHGRLSEAVNELAANLHLVLLLNAGLVLSLRVISFVGGRTFVALMTGRYHRPVRERHVLVFLDMTGSTTLVERLGALRGREAIDQIITFMSRLVIEYGGDVYTFTGDGLVGIWEWAAALRDATILHFAHAALAAVRDLKPAYERDYAATPEVRIGIHGGEVVVSQEGDIRRAIGIWGDVINIAARLEQHGRRVKKNCLISKELVSELDVRGFDLQPLAPIHVDGISRSVTAYTLESRLK